MRLTVQSWLHLVFVWSLFPNSLVQVVGLLLYIEPVLQETLQFVLKILIYGFWGMWSQGCQSSTFWRNSSFLCVGGGGGGGLSLFFKWFSVFFEKLPKEKNTALQHHQYWKSSKSIGKQSLTSSFADVRFFRFRSKFESIVSALGTMAVCGLTKRRRWCLNSLSFWPLTFTSCFERGRRRWCLSGGMEDGSMGGGCVRVSIHACILWMFAFINLFCFPVCVYWCMWVFLHEKCQEHFFGFVRFINIHYYYYYYIFTVRAFLQWLYE